MSWWVVRRAAVELRFQIHGVKNLVQQNFLKPMIYQLIDHRQQQFGANQVPWKHRAEQRHLADDSQSGLNPAHKQWILLDFHLLQILFFTSIPSLPTTMIKSNWFLDVLNQINLMSSKEMNRLRGVLILINEKWNRFGPLSYESLCY